MCIYAFCFCDFVFVFFCARYFSDLFISCFSVLSEFRFDLTFLMTDTTHSLSSSISLLVLLFSYESRTREGIYALLCFAVLYGVLKKRRSTLPCFALCFTLLTFFHLLYLFIFILSVYSVHAHQLYSVQQYDNIIPPHSLRCARDIFIFRLQSYLSILLLLLLVSYFASTR